MHLRYLCLHERLFIMCLYSLASGRSVINFEIKSGNTCYGLNHENFLYNCPQVNVSKHFWWTPGNKPLPEPMLISIYICHIASWDHNLIKKKQWHQVDTQGQYFTTCYANVTIALENLPIPQKTRLPFQFATSYILNRNVVNTSEWCVDEADMDVWWWPWYLNRWYIGFVVWMTV